MYRADGTTIRVLLVDDERALTNLVRMACSTRAGTSTSRTTPRACRKVPHEHPRTSWVLDIMLPDMDGLESVAAPQGSGTYTPTLFLTARGLGVTPGQWSWLSSPADGYMNQA